MKERKIPRWMVENDVSWEKSLDSNLGVLKWTKKGTNLQAICSATSLYCEILGNEDEKSVFDFIPNPEYGKRDLMIADLGKFLSSRYLNPTMSRPLPFSFPMRDPRRYYEL